MDRLAREAPAPDLPSAWRQLALDGPPIAQLPASVPSLLHGFMGGNSPYTPSMASRMGSSLHSAHSLPRAADYLHGQDGGGNDPRLPIAGWRSAADLDKGTLGFEFILNAGAQRRTATSLLTWVLWDMMLTNSSALEQGPYHATFTAAMAAWKGRQSLAYLAQSYRHYKMNQFDTKFSPVGNFSIEALWR